MFAIVRRRKVISWENIQDSVESIRNAGYNNLIIFGDFNADPGNRPMWNKFRYFCQSVSLNFHISEATRTRLHKSRGSRSELEFDLSNFV